MTSKDYYKLGNTYRKKGDFKQYKKEKCGKI